MKGERIMKKWLLVPIFTLMLGLVLLGGCSTLGVVAAEDLAKANSDLAVTQNDLAATQNGLVAIQNDLATTQNALAATQKDLAAAKADLVTAKNRNQEIEAQVASLSAISAYNIWYDQYYSIGNYLFADVAAFNTKLGALVNSTGDTASKAAWDDYIAGDTALTSLLAELPEDSLAWTAEQYNKWLEASTVRYNALGAAGTALFNAIVK